jgi:hypothetical protein
LKLHLTPRTAPFHNISDPTKGLFILSRIKRMLRPVRNRLVQRRSVSCLFVINDFSLAEKAPFLEA